MQRLAAVVTARGLRVESTSDTEGRGTLTVRAEGVGRGGDLRPVGPGRVIVGAAKRTATVIRAGLVEEYSASIDGVRQDFVLAERPAGRGPLHMALAVSGASVSEAATGLLLKLRSGRELSYAELAVKDAARRPVPAQLTASPGGIHIAIDDAGARYPLRIDPTVSDAQWHSLGGVAGVGGTVDAAVVGTSGEIYVGGYFSGAGDVVVKNVAMWDGSTWSALGSGLNDQVTSLAVDPSTGTLYAGGLFYYAGSVKVNYVAQWDGSAWSALGGGMSFFVHALAVDGSGNLYAGGEFTTAGGVSANYVAEWNGSAWSALGSGTDNFVNALAIGTGGELYVGGDFANAGSVAASCIAQWNGSTWSALGAGVSDTSTPSVDALAVDSSNNLYAGGRFTTAGAATVNNVAIWNGSAWSALGSGVNATADVVALAVDGTGNVYAGGNFYQADGAVVNDVAEWNGSAWSALGTGISGGFMGVRALASDGSGNLYVGGDFTGASGVSASGIAQWNGSTWSALSSGPVGVSSVRAVALDASGNLYVGGAFTNSGGVAANRVAEYNGSTWQALGTGMNDTVYALAFYGGNLIAGGQFSQAGGSARAYVAEWTGSSWSSTWGGTGPDNDVYALAADGSGNLYVGGGFNTAGGVTVNRVAEYNGSTWSALGSGIGGVVNALAVDASSGTVYAAGSFSTAGGVAVNNIAQWDGSAWSAVGSGFDQPVNALVVDGSGNLYAGGAFLNAGTLPAARVAEWDGSAWSALGGGTDGTVYGLALDSLGTLYAAGYYLNADGAPAYGIAQWRDGAWSALGSGAQDVRAVAVDDSGNLYIGGNFVVAGSTVSPGAARFDLPPSVVLNATASEPTSASPITVTATFSEPISGLAVGDFTVSNGSLTNLVEVTAGRAYTVDIDPASSGTVTLTLPADVVQALSDGNGNYASNTVSRTFDTTAPLVSSITRVDPTPTNADTVTFTVTFSEPVTGVDAADFALTTTGTVSGVIGAVSGSGATYTVSVGSVAGDGTLRLDLAATPTIADLAANSLVAPFTAGEIYTIDNSVAAPIIAAIADDSGVPDDGVTNDTTLIVSGTTEASATVEVFREGNVSLGTTTADNSGTWSLDCSSTPFTEGTHSLTAIATDPVGNVSVASAPFALTIDTTPPAVDSIAATDPSPTNATTVHFTVTLSEAVNALTATDLVLTKTGTADGTIADVTGSAQTYSITVSSVSGDGTLGLDVSPSATATDLAGNSVVGPQAPGDTYTFDHTPPTVTSIQRASASPTQATSIVFNVTFDEPVTHVDASSFVLTTTGSASASVASVTGSDASYAVTADSVTGSGTIRLDIVDTPTIADLVGNPLAGPYTAGEAYTVGGAAGTGTGHSEVSRGCSCNTGTTPNGSTGLLLGAGIIVGFIRRRRRRT